MSQHRWIKNDTLKCLHCGGELEIGADRDGESTNAEKYDETSSPNWEYLIAMECEKCGAVYPIMRAKSLRFISAIAHKKDCSISAVGTNSEKLKTC